jgi:hypothetical protein
MFANLSETIHLLRKQGVKYNKTGGGKISGFPTQSERRFENRLGFEQEQAHNRETKHRYDLNT